MPSGSRPLIGSSNSRTGGSPRSAAPIPRRWAIPSEKPPVRRRAASARPTSSSTSSTRFRGRRLLLREPEEVIAGAPPGMGRAGVEERADLARAGVRARGISSRSRAPRPCPAASSPRITRIVVDLPAPFGPTKPVTRPALNREREIVDRDRLPVSLREIAYFDRCVHAEARYDGGLLVSSRARAVLRAHSTATAGRHVTLAVGGIDLAVADDAAPGVDGDNDLDELDARRSARAGSLDIEPAAKEARRVLAGPDGPLALRARARSRRDGRGDALHGRDRVGDDRRTCSRRCRSHCPARGSGWRRP